MSTRLKLPKHPLAEIFGFPYNDTSAESIRHREKRLCPFNNKVPSCTKDKANDPLGVCSIFDQSTKKIAITCPIRFRENWIIVDDAASFFFSKKSKWTTLTEIKLVDKQGKSAGNIDIVLVSYDRTGKIVDFGALEVQAVYISGNIRKPFEEYMKDPSQNMSMSWAGRSLYPRADYLSSSRKRLLPQLVYKGRILRSWRKKISVAIHAGFYDTLPQLPRVTAQKAEIAWFIYDVKFSPVQNKFSLIRVNTVYTLFDPALATITTANAGPIEDFINILQEKLDQQLETSAPNAKTLLEESEE